MLVVINVDKNKIEMVFKLSLILCMQSKYKVKM